MSFKLKLLYSLLLTFVIISALNAAPLRQTVGDKYAAVNEHFLNKAILYLKNENTDALKKLEKAYLVTKLKPGIKVEILKNSERFPDNMKILLLDADLTLWTTSDAVKKIQRKIKKGKDAAAEDGQTTPKSTESDDSKDEEDKSEEDDTEESSNDEDDDDDEWE